MGVTSAQFICGFSAPMRQIHILFMKDKACFWNSLESVHGGRHWDEKAISVISGFKLNLGLGGKNTQNCIQKKMS